MKRRLFLMGSLLTIASVLVGNSEGSIDSQHDVLYRVYKEEKPWVYREFDEAMQTAQFTPQIMATKHRTGIDGVTFLSFCRELYNKNNPSTLPLSDTPLIPKIIHQIWLGCPVPEAFREYMRSWTQKHVGPEWEYRLWTDKEVEQLDMQNRSFYDAATCPAMKSDIVRYEIVYKLGGVYIDTDFECFKALDILHHQYDFYTALQPLDTDFAQLGSALFGAVPGHPILKDCIDNVKNNWSNSGSAPEKTGPIPFTCSFFMVAGKDNSKDVAFPSFYFYPLGCKEHELKKEEWLKKGAFAVHHWAKSWLPARFRLIKFKQLGNDELVKR